MVNYLRIMGVSLGIGVSLVLGACSNGIGEGGTLGSPQAPSDRDLEGALSAIHQTGKSPFLGPESEPVSFIDEVFSGTPEFFGVGINASGLFVANTGEGLVGFDGNKSLWSVPAVSINGFVDEAGVRKDPVVLSNGDTFYLSNAGLMVRVNSLGKITGEANLSGGNGDSFSANFFLTPNLDESAILFSHESGHLVLVDSSSMAVTEVRDPLTSSESLSGRPVFMSNSVIALLISKGNLSQAADRVDFVLASDGTVQSTFSLPAGTDLLGRRHEAVVVDGLLVFGTLVFNSAQFSRTSNLYAISESSLSADSDSFWKSMDISGGFTSFFGSPAVGEERVYVMQSYSSFPSESDAQVFAFSLDDGVDSNDTPVWSFAPSDSGTLAQFNEMANNLGICPVVDGSGKLYLAGRSHLFVISDDGTSASLAQDPFSMDGQTFDGRPHFYSIASERYILAPLNEGGVVKTLSLLKSTL